MTRRPQHRGERLPALFGFEAGDPNDAVEEVTDNPRRRPCPTCHARVAEPCTRGVRGGHIPIQGYHDARNPTTTKEAT